MSLKTKLFIKTKRKRVIFFLIGDIVLISFSCWLAFLLRFDGKIPVKYLLMLRAYILLTIPIILFFFWLEKLYTVSWSFVSVNELTKIGRAIIFSFLVISSILFVFRDSFVFKGFPRSIIFITAFLIFLFISFFRVSKRIYLFTKSAKLYKKGKKTLIIGAGDAGEQLLRHIFSLKKSPYFPIGFIDDNPIKQGISIHGVIVLGKIKDLPRIIKEKEVEEIIIAMPSAPSEVIRKTVELARKARIDKVKIIPSTQQILNGEIMLSQIRKISIEDLLGREKIEINDQLIKNFIKDKIILVTGAAGSIGSHLCEQILRYNPKLLITFDQRETASFYLERELNEKFPQIPKKIIIGDICDKDKVDWLFNEFKPSIVFHAAAYKHVPMMEAHPDEAVKNNVFGTLNLAESSLKNNVKNFVFISTDKAIKPTSVMGATKQIGEQICQFFNKKGKTKFCAVRFGNVLGSQGSVVPVFEREIEKGGPVEITHPEMKRYFMVTDEACLLVMQAAAFGKGGEIFVLDIGKPIKIVDLAREMIKLAGCRPDIDIPIVFTKPRPGEKISEQILSGSEMPTKYEKIFVSKLVNFDERKLTDGLKKLKVALQNRDKDEIIELLEEIVAEYKHS